MSTASQRQASSMTQTVKLRAACVHCTNLKVKCSGEKSGCLRCQNLAVECTYLESRVGKVPGIRAKKNRAANKSTSSPATAASVGASPATHQRPSDFSDKAISNTFDPSVQGWTPNSSDMLDFNSWTDSYANDQAMDTTGSMGINTSDTSFNMGSSGVTIASPMETPFFDIGRGKSLSSPSLQGNLPLDICQQQDNIAHLPSYLARRDSKPDNQVESQCVLACIAIISSLENYILTDLRSMELILQASWSANDQLDTLLDMQRDIGSVRCMMLISTALHQLFQLVEVGCSTILADEISQGSSPQNAISTKLTGLAGFGRFGFGASNLDAEEQLAWNARKMAKELRHSINILQKVSMLARGGIEPQATCPPVVERDWCFDELAKRMNHLHSRLCLKAEC